MAGRGVPAPTCIVDPNELLNLQQIREEVVTFYTFVFEGVECIRWLARRGLLCNSLDCEDCYEAMQFVRRQQTKDGFTWHCKGCHKFVAIRKGSFFARSNLSLRQIVTLLYGWSQSYSQVAIGREAQVGTKGHTVVDWYNFCRDVCQQYLLDHPVTLGGLNDDGTSKVVEVDESYFFHRKYHRGMWRNGRWVFGGVERGSGKCFLVEVANRDADTLETLIQMYVKWYFT